MNILEFSIKAFVLLLKSFARGSKNCDAGEEATASLPSGKGRAEVGCGGTLTAQALGEVLIK